MSGGAGQLPLATVELLSPSSRGFRRCAEQPDGRVYDVCMARVNVYLPDDLAARVRAAGVNVSAVTRSALESELGRNAASGWLARAAELPALGVGHEQVLEALAAARDELAGDDDRA